MTAGGGGGDPIDKEHGYVPVSFSTSKIRSVFT